MLLKRAQTVGFFRNTIGSIDYFILIENNLKFLK